MVRAANPRACYSRMDPIPLRGGLLREGDPADLVVCDIRAAADLIVNTSKFTVHDLREFIGERFRGARDQSNIMIYVTSFGYRHGVPADSDLVFDVRFLPNPNYIPRFKNLTGKNPGVAKYIRSFPQTMEFISRISDLLIYLLPHYISEGKSYLTIAFGCTGGQHRSVMIADEIRGRSQLELIREPELGVVLFRRRGWPPAQYTRWADQLLRDQVAFIPPSAWEGETVARFAFLHPHTSMDLVREILDRMR